jgi:hypothetical protein
MEFFKGKGRASQKAVGPYMASWDGEAGKRQWVLCCNAFEATDNNLWVGKDLGGSSGPG